MNTVQCSPYQTRTIFRGKKGAEGVHIREDQYSIHSLLLKFPDQFSVSGMKNGQGKYSEEMALRVFSLQLFLKIQIKKINHNLIPNIHFSISAIAEQGSYKIIKTGGSNKARCYSHARKYIKVPELSHLCKSLWSVYARPN